MITPKIRNLNGIEKMKNFHVHFSKIQYSAKGEIRHLTFEDMEYGQIRTVLIAEINALRNMVDDYGLSQGIKKGLELAVKWRIEDIMKK